MKCWGCGHTKRKHKYKKQNTDCSECDCQGFKKTKKQNQPIQREEGNIYCYCDNLPKEKVSVSVNYQTKKLMCSVCGFEMEWEE